MWEDMIMNKDDLILLKRLLAIILILCILMPLNPFISLAQTNDVRVMNGDKSATNQILRKSKGKLQLESLGTRETGVDWLLTYFGGEEEISSSEAVKVHITLSPGQVLAPLDISKIDKNIITIKAINRNYPEEEITIYDLSKLSEGDSIDSLTYNADLLDESKFKTHTLDSEKIEKYVIEFSNLNSTNTFYFSTLIENNESLTREVFAELESDPTVNATATETLNINI